MRESAAERQLVLFYIDTILVFMDTFGLQLHHPAYASNTKTFLAELALQLCRNLRHN